MTAPAGGACTDLPTEMFFPEVRTGGDNHGRSAKAVCAACPVRVACITDSVARDEPYGIWGGAGEDERRWLRRAWVLDGGDGGPIWSAALAHHLARLAGERVPVVNRNGPGATCGLPVTYARNCRCSACSWAASRRGNRSKVAA